MQRRFGNQLFHARIRRQLLQKQVALSAGVDASYLAAIEHGRRLPPKEAVLHRLLDALKLSAAEKRELESAAFMERITSYLIQAEPNVRGASTLIRLADALPRLNDKEVSALEDLLDAMSDQEKLSIEE